MTGRRILAAVIVIILLLTLPALVRASSPPAPRSPSSTFDLDAERITAAAVSRSRPTTTTSTTEPPTTTTTSSTSTTTSPPRSTPPTSPFASSFEGAKGVHPSAGELIGQFTVTCYGPGDGFPAGQHTANGDPVGPGSVAVDPRIIPLGTGLILEGLEDPENPSVADDTGGAIRGYHVDQWRADCSTSWPNPVVNIYRR